MSGVPPRRDSENYTHAMPFGVSQKMPPGVLGYFSNLLGDIAAPIIIAHQHLTRPEPTNPGSVIFYATDSTGAEVTVKVEFEGTEKMYRVTSDNVSLVSDKMTFGSDSSDEPLVLGNAFTTLHDMHMHGGNLGAPTTAPLTPLSGHLSERAFTEV